MNNLLSSFYEQAAIKPNALAASDSTREITYGKLLDNALRFYSSASGYKYKTKKVAIYLPNGVDALSVIVSALTAGLSYSVLDLDTPPDRNKLICDTGEFDFLITTEAFFESANKFFDPEKILIYSDTINKDATPFDAIPDIEPGDYSIMFFTSGSTGVPKCVVHTHERVSNGLHDSINELQVNEKDCFDMIVPLSFAASMNVFLALQRACPIHFFDVKKQGIHAYVKFLHDRNITISVMTATAFRAVCKIIQVAGTGRFSSFRLIVMAVKYIRKNKPAPSQQKVNKIQAIKQIVRVAGVGKLPKLRMVNLVGEPVLPADIELFKSVTENNAELLQLYGTSETRAISINRIKHSSKIEDRISAGLPFGRNEIFIVDEDLKILPPEKEGQIMVASPYLAMGYYNNIEATREAFIKHPEAGKDCYLTGDMGYLSTDGQLYHLGRIDSMVKVRGNRVDILDIENCLLLHPDISHVAVVNKGSSFSETLLVAYLVPKNNVTINLIKEYTKSKLPEYMVPAFFVVKENLPQTITGKTNRKQLAEEALDFSGIIDKGDDYQLETDPIYQNIKKIVMEVLGLPRLSAQNCFFNDLGGDSILAATVISRIQDEMNIELPYFILYRYRTLDKLVAYIRREGNKTVTIDTIRKPANPKSPVILFVPPVKGGIDNYNFSLTAFPQEYGLYAVSYNIADEKTKNFHSLDYLMESAAEAIERMNIEKFSILGYSMGGLLAYEIAARVNPQKVQKVIILDIPPAKYKRINIVRILMNDIRLFFINTKSKNYKARNINKWHMLMCLYYLFSFTHKIRRFEMRNTTSMAEAAHLRFFRQMSHKPFKGDMLLFRTSDPVFKKYKYNWEKYVKGKIETEQIDSTHLQLLSSKNIDALTSKIIKSIEQQ